MKKTALIPLVLVSLVSTCALAQPYFTCKNAAGKVQYSDKPCADATHIVPLVLPAESNLPQRKTENDALISKEKVLGDRMQSSRVANEQAGFAAQAQQVQAARNLASKIEQDRTTQRAATNSVLPADAGPVNTAPRN